MRNARAGPRVWSFAAKPRSGLILLRFLILIVSHGSQCCSATREWDKSPSLPPVRGQEPLRTASTAKLVSQFNSGIVEDDGEQGFRKLPRSGLGICETAKLQGYDANHESKGSES